MTVLKCDRCKRATKKYFAENTILNLENEFKEKYLKCVKCLSTNVNMPKTLITGGLVFKPLIICNNCYSKVKKPIPHKLFTSFFMKETPAKSKEIKCNNCGAIISKEDKFCKKCGSPVQVQKIEEEEQLEEKAEINSCPTCGSPIEKDHLFCRECGTKLEEEL